MYSTDHFIVGLFLIRQIVIHIKKYTIVQYSGIDF